MTFAHATLATRDVRATSQFFVDTLGWTPIEKPGNIDVRAAWLKIGQGQELHLLQIDDFAPSEHEAEFGRHIAVFYPGDQFGSLKQRLSDAGAELIPAKRPTPFQRFFFRESNGYVFEVIDQQGYENSEGR